MCGRYQFTEPQNADLRRILQDVRRRCGAISGGMGISLNLLLFAGKLLAGRC